MSTKVAENPQNHWKIGKPYGFIRKIGKSLEKLENPLLLLEKSTNHWKGSVFQCDVGTEGVLKRDS